MNCYKAQICEKLCWGMSLESKNSMLYSCAQLEVCFCPYGSTTTMYSICNIAPGLA